MADFLGGVVKDIGSLLGNTGKVLAGQNANEQYVNPFSYNAPAAATSTTPGSTPTPGAAGNPGASAQQALNNAYYSTFAPIGKSAYYDTGAAYAQARAQATGDNPTNTLYNKMINEFNSNVDAQRQGYQSQEQLNESNIQNVLANTLQQNQITGQRVGEDTSTALSNLANYQQNYKETEGLNFDQAQRALQGNIGAAGTASSGLGQQQVAQAQKQEQLGQQAQGQQYQTQRQAEQLFANRSFEDLSRSSGQAQTSAGLQTQGSKLNLNSQLLQLGNQQLQTADKLQQDQLAAQNTLANSYYQQGLGKFYDQLSKSGASPFDIQATINRYGVGL